MFISRFNAWLNEVDPYSLQRLILYKALFLATIEVYIYWLFHPHSIRAFIAPFFLLSFYEAPIIAKFKEKDRLLIFITIATIIVSVSFYLMYPFKVTFWFFSVLVLAGLYFYVIKHFYMLKNITMLLLATAALVLSTQEPANLQVAYGMISSILLAMSTVYVALKLFPNHYLIVWNRALQKFIHYLEKDIECIMKQLPHLPIKEAVGHFDMVSSFQKVLPKKYLLQTYRMVINIRNIQLSLDNSYFEEKNEAFWYKVKEHLNHLRLNMPSYTICDTANITLEAETKLQIYVGHCLQQAYIHWNKLCTIRKS